MKLKKKLQQLKKIEDRNDKRVKEWRARKKEAQKDGKSGSKS